MTKKKLETRFFVLFIIAMVNVRHKTMLSAAASFRTMMIR